MRPYTARMKPPFTMIGSSVAVVEESTHPSYTKGSTIVIMAGWVERGVVSPDSMGKDSPGGSLGGVMPAPDLGLMRSAPGSSLLASITPSTTRSVELQKVWHR